MVGNMLQIIVIAIIRANKGNLCARVVARLLVVGRNEKFKISAGHWFR